MGVEKYAGVQSVFTHHSLVCICLVNVVCLLLWLVFWICFTWNLPDTSFLILACACIHTRTHTHTHMHAHTTLAYVTNVLIFVVWNKITPPTVTRMCTLESVFFVSFSQFLRSIGNVPWFHACLAVPFFLVCVVFSVYQVHQKCPSVSCLPSCTFPFLHPSSQLLLLLSVEGVLCEVPLAFGFCDCGVLCYS